MKTSLDQSLIIPFIDKTNDYYVDNNISILQATDLTCDFQKFDLPICFQQLERYLEKI
ncbi:hypothetical protein BLA29_015191 [Euroglyphus maynei]|uniref:Uncharacterized protein n=1 Tax=Euroglyphus maynei TaxID=6958 RepID=A0A1Y3B6Q3_EURMA|nr:hypothetical protein BLA29_015191 [Euroglyphus maynei]